MGFLPTDIGKRSIHRVDRINPANPRSPLAGTLDWAWIAVPGLNRMLEVVERDSGQLVGPGYKAGPNGLVAHSFDGTNDYVNLSDFIADSGSITLHLLVYCNDYDYAGGLNRRRGIIRADDGGSNYLYVIICNGGDDELVFRWTNTVGGNYSYADWSLAGGANIQEKKWQLLTIVCDAADQSHPKLYINGVEQPVGYDTGTGTAATIDTDWKLGDSERSSQYWDGDIAFVGVANVVQNPGLIKAWANEILGGLPTFLRRRPVYYSPPSGGAPQTIDPSSIASLEAFGSCSLGLVLSGTGIASLEAFGSSTLVPGAVTVSPSGIASLEAFGSSVVSTGVILSPSAIASAESFPTPALSLDIAGTGITSLEAFPSPSLALSVTSASIDSLEAFGTLSANMGLSAPSITSLEAFPTPTVEVGQITLSPSAIPAAEAFGSLVVAGPISLSGIASAEAFGSASLTQPSTVASMEASLVHLYTLEASATHTYTMPASIVHPIT